MLGAVGVGISISNCQLLFFVSERLGDVLELARVARADVQTAEQVVGVDIRSRGLSDFHTELARCNAKCLLKLGGQLDVRPVLQFLDRVSDP
jgi:hypothetical protein